MATRDQIKKADEQINKASEVLKEEQTAEKPIVVVNDKGQLEDADGKPIVDESGKPVCATKE